VPNRQVILTFPKSASGGKGPGRNCWKWGFRGNGSLLLAQKQIHDPTAPDMRPRMPAMIEHVGIVAASIRQGVGEHRQVLKVAIVVNGLSEFWNDAIIPRKQGGVDDRGGAEGVPNDVSQEVAS